MKRRHLAAVAAAPFLALLACSRQAVTTRETQDTPSLATKPADTLAAFASEQELAAFIRKIAADRRRAAADDFSAGAMAFSEVVVASADESITNVQHEGVDEGGIVKLHGDHLVILRRGRLFTVAVGGDELQPISSIDAFGPEVDPKHAWYDEMLISGDLIAVIGYSYERHGTEIGLFEIDRRGLLRYRSTYQLRSGDYYSSRDYASRLVDGKLVFYAPLNLPWWENDPLVALPALRKWTPGSSNADFRRIVTATRIYRPARALDPTDDVTLHTVTVCDPKPVDLQCEATVVIGQEGSSSYFSARAAYIWTTSWNRDTASSRNRDMLYRIPLDGSAPSALGVTGSPVDQFSFLESEDGYLNVLVLGDAGGSRMWSGEYAGGDVTLMRVPLSSFSNGSADVPLKRYRPLPKSQSGAFHNRFVGQYVLYGTGSGWGRPKATGEWTLYAAPIGGGEHSAIDLPHGVDRIEAMGADAVVVGTTGTDLLFSSIRLDERPQLMHRYTQKSASQGELRSHGFFYKPDGPRSGLIGLPVRGPGRPGYEHLFDESASVLYLESRDGRFRKLGDLDGQPRSVEDACRASCVDWYGNTRPLFLRGRIFALLGYEIVEGELVADRIREARRISFAPQLPSKTGR